MKKSAASALWMLLVSAPMMALTGCPDGTGTTDAGDGDGDGDTGDGDGDGDTGDGDGDGDTGDGDGDGDTGDGDGDGDGDTDGGIVDGGDGDGDGDGDTDGGIVDGGDGDADAGDGDGDIVDVATEAGNFTTLLAALDATELDDVLRGEGPYTVFAPTDAAFEALFTELDITAEELLANEDLSNILLYHVLNGSVMSGDVATGPVDTASGLTVWANAEAGVMINDASVVADGADVMASNGVIHIVDKVIMPANIAEIAGYAGLDTLLAAVTEAELAGAVTDEENPVTVFAPTEDAFGALLATLEIDAAALLADPELADILLYHVVGAEVMSDDVTTGPVATAGGLSAWANTENGVMINDATVSIADIKTTTGVVHVIDTVILRSNIAELATYAGLTKLVAALGAADLVGAVTENVDPITVFAPIDPAFEAAYTALSTTEEALFADTATLTTILTYHVYGAAARSGDLTDGPLTMLSTEDAVVNTTNLTIAGAQLNADLLDIEATNGVIHVVNDVMVPPSL